MPTALTTSARIQLLMHRGFTYVEIAALLDCDVADVAAYMLDPTDVPTAYLGD